MSKPTNPILVSNFTENLVSKKTADQEVWAITTQMLVPKGSNMEQILADIMTGKYNDDPTKLMTFGTAVTDVTKLG